MPKEYVDIKVECEKHNIEVEWNVLRGSWDFSKKVADHYFHTHVMRDDLRFGKWTEINYHNTENGEAVPRRTTRRAFSEALRELIDYVERRSHSNDGLD